MFVRYFKNRSPIRYAQWARYGRPGGNAIALTACTAAAKRAAMIGLTRRVTVMCRDAAAKNV